MAAYLLQAGCATRLRDQAVADQDDSTRSCIEHEHEHEHEHNSTAQPRSPSMPLRPQYSLAMSRSSGWQWETTGKPIPERLQAAQSHITMLHSSKL